MSRKVYLVEKRGLGCCNMVIWDAIAIILLSVDFFTQIVGIHIVFAILIGLAVFIALFSAMNLRQQVLPIPISRDLGFLSPRPQRKHFSVCGAGSFVICINCIASIPPSIPSSQPPFRGNRR